MSRFNHGKHKKNKKTSKLSFSDNLEVKYIINERDDSGYNY